jgi:3-oxoacyl-[acyl-carrier protein] reductase
MTHRERSAIITGASMGFGAAVADRFAAAGISLLLCARDADKLEEQRARMCRKYPDVRILAQPADVADEAQVESLFAAGEKAFGRLDILVNNAGVYGPIGPLETVDWREWVDAIAINLLGLVYCCRTAVPLFKRHNYGKIINLSGGGATNPLPGISAYAASKAAVVRLTETLALEVKEFGIDVNAIAPGLLATRLTDQLISAGPEKVGATLHERISKAKDEGGTPLEIGAELCLYLASPASDGLSGRLIAAPWDPWPFDEAVKRELAQSDIYTLRRIVPQERGKSWDKK